MMITSQKQATGFAHGKVILIGEHAAVYEKPAIALPCTAVQTTVTIQSADKGIYIYCDLYQGVIDDMPELLASLRTIIHTTLHFLNKENAHLHIYIDSTIPIERGMGSSAAVSVAVVRALFNYFNRPIRENILLELVAISEKIVHGNPSGLDATIVVKQRPLLFKKNCPMLPLSIQSKGYLIIADTGITGRTKQAIEHVKKIQKSNPQLHHNLMNKLERLTYHVTKDLALGNLFQLGAHLSKAHQYLQQLGVSHHALDNLVNLALEHQALGAKMTGGGLGGCMIVLTDTLTKATELATILEENGAKQTFIQAL